MTVELPAEYYLKILSQRAEMKKVERWLADIIDSHQFSGKLPFALDMLLNESLMNIIMHGYQQIENGEIDITLSIETRKITIQIIDTAPQFNLLDAPEMQPQEDLEHARIGGCGVQLIKSYSDEIHYQQHNGANHLTMSVFSGS